MFSLSISFGPIGTTWRLLFKTQAAAENVFANLSMARMQNRISTFDAPMQTELQDDFGQRAMLRLDAVHAAMLENLDEAKIGNVEMMLHNTRVQADAQKRAAADPALRAGMTQQRGPAILNPMGNGPFAG